MSDTLKSLRNYFITTLILIAIVLIASFFGYQKGIEKTNAKYINLIDSINSVVQEPADTLIISDTIYLNKIVYQEKFIPIQEETKGDTSYYNDTVRDEHLEFWIKEHIAGSIISRSTGYNLKAPLIIHDTIRIFKPIPRIITEYRDSEKIEYKSYLTGALGYDYYSAGYARIIKKRHSIGLNTAIFKGTPTLYVSYSYFMN